MLNPFKEVRWKPDVSDRRKFARSWVIGFPGVAILILVAGRLKTGVWNFTPPLWIGGVGCVLGVVLYALPKIALPFYLVWYAVACAIGLVVGNVLLGLVYYVIVTTMGLLKRAFGTPHLRKTLDHSCSTYWQDAAKIDDPKRYYRQF